MPRNLVAFQCSSASRKFLNRRDCVVTLLMTRISVLFSEPKIPQSHNCSGIICYCRHFSALQRAENSSIVLLPSPEDVLQKSHFSALQRAENSSIEQSAPAARSVANFSALQRAENSSIMLMKEYAKCRLAISVLFSEPKIPQST